MPQICVRFRDHDFDDIEERANHMNTTKPRVVQRIVENALLQAHGTEGMPEWPEPSAQQEQIQSWKDRLDMFKRQLNEKESETSERIASLELQLRDKNEELGFLRHEYSTINAALSQRLLVDGEHKKGWFERAADRLRSR